jgi:hypothetical protein
VAFGPRHRLVIQLESVPCFRLVRLGMVFLLVTPATDILLLLCAPFVLAQPCALFEILLSLADTLLHFL